MSSFCSFTTMRESIESPQVSYIIPENRQRESLCHPSNRGTLRRVLQWCLVLLGAIVVILSIVVIHGRWKIYSERWDSQRMGRLQPVLLEQVRTLLVTANRSIHDEASRQHLRNLSRDDPHTCYTPNCLHTGELNFSKLVHR